MEIRIGNCDESCHVTNISVFMKCSIHILQYYNNKKSKKTQNNL